MSGRVELPPPAAGHRWYVPGLYWLGDKIDFRAAFHLTVRSVGPWVTHYEAHRSVLSEAFRTGPPVRLTIDDVPREARAGRLPDAEGARGALLDRLLGWLHGADGAHVIFSDLVLTRDGQPVLHADHGFGIPGALHLTPAQVAEIQAVWRAHGLPEDLYAG